MSCILCNGVILPQPLPGSDSDGVDVVQGEEDIYNLLEKNRDTLEQVVDRLCSEPYELSGDELRSIVAAHGDSISLERLKEDAATFL